MTSSKSVKIFIKNEDIDMYLFVYNDEFDEWDLFSGTIKTGENPFTAINREVAEKLNIKISNIKQIRPRKTTDELKGRIFEFQGYYFIGTTDIYDPSEVKLSEGQITEFFSLDEMMKKKDVYEPVEELISKKYVE